jgi:hypothetical protein
MFGNFPKASPIERGCGERKAGGLYIESGLSPFGVSPEELMYDPALPLPPGLDLINKPQVLARVDRESGEALLDPDTGRTIYDLYIWIGAEHYRHLPDFVEEARVAGVSRRISENVPVELLSQESFMILAHPHARIASWKELQLPRVCRKSMLRHDLADFASLEIDPLSEPDRRLGPCVFKTWETIGEEEAALVFPRDGEETLYYRQVGETRYRFYPSGEQVAQWEPGFFMRLKPTGFALIQYGDKTVNEKAKAKVMKGVELHGLAACLPFYETDK